MWDERYAGEDYAYGREPNEFLVEQLDELYSLNAPARILCVAEGEGRNAVYLARLGHEVTAVDLSRVGLDKALSLAEEFGVSIRDHQADLASYEPEEDYYDAIVMIFAHTPSAVRKPLYARLMAALKNDGLLLLEGYTPDQLGRGTGGPPSEDMMFTLAELRDYLQDMSFLHAVEKIRPLHEGHLHTGEGAVVQLVAQKQPPGSRYLPQLDSNP
ncbi:class I SAM-dependent methyltransferase [Marinospirillum perlucidum]|uniref:class I SAM-dependent methyltransferase n=1 Tax=Marinospirillum perlucidum TaxID=1982602 RepID=UPI000DF268FC|nr:class I SAM-dependent methyltransferase [Marinospirillum perlucidum]